MYGSDLKVSLIVVASGVGSRMQLNYPKQFYIHNGNYLFTYPMMKDIDIIDEIIVVTNSEYIDKVKEICKKYEKVKKVVVGGKTRQESVYNGLKNVNGDIVIVQDGVRPHMKRKYIEQGCKILTTENKSVGIGVKVKDTIKIIDENGNILKTPNRENLIAIHTPQIFYYDELKKAHEIAEHSNFVGTDDLSLIENIGLGAKILIGDYDNIKITTIEDLKYI